MLVHAAAAGGSPAMNEEGHAAAAPARSPPAGGHPPRPRRPHPPLRQGLKAKEAKFACRDRAALLSCLYRAVELAGARGSSGLGPTLLGCVGGMQGDAEGWPLAGRPKVPCWSDGQTRCLLLPLLLWPARARCSPPPHCPQCMPPRFLPLAGRLRSFGGTSCARGGGRWWCCASRPMQASRGIVVWASQLAGAVVPSQQTMGRLMDGWMDELTRVPAVERVDPASGLVKWRLEYGHMASPAGGLPLALAHQAARDAAPSCAPSWWLPSASVAPALLPPCSFGTVGPSGGCDSPCCMPTNLLLAPCPPFRRPVARLLAPGDGQPAGQTAFALFGKTGRSPRVYCCAQRDMLLRAMQVGGRGGWRGHIGKALGQPSGLCCCPLLCSASAADAGEHHSVCSVRCHNMFLPQLLYFVCAGRRASQAGPDPCRGRQRAAGGAPAAGGGGGGRAGACGHRGGCAAGGVGGDESEGLGCG